MAATARQKSFDPYRNVGYAYEGSAARVLEQEEVLQPRTQPRVRPRHVQLERPKVEVRPAGKLSLFAVTGFAAVAVLAVMVLMSVAQLTSLSDQVVSMEAQIAQLKQEENTLTARYEMAYDLGAIESAVTAEGTMSRPQQGQTIYVDLTEPDNVILYQQEESSLGFFDQVEEWIGNILACFG